MRQFGDDYAEENAVLVDMDQGAPGLEAPDVLFDVKPSRLRTLKPGQPITFVGVIRGIERGPAGRLLRLEVSTIE